MSTPKIITAGVSEFNEATLNKFIAGDGTKVQIKVQYATIVYSGGSLILDPTSDVCGFVIGDFVYNGGADTLDITLAGFTNRPNVQVNRLSLGTNYLPSPLLVSNTSVKLEFYDPTDLTTTVTPGAVDANMNFSIFCIGF